MENKINGYNVDIEAKNFESFVGKLTEKYPFEYSISYNLNNYTNCLILNPD